MTQTAFSLVAAINNASMIIKEYDRLLDNCMNCDQYDFLMNRMVDVQRAAEFLARELAESLKTSIELEAEIGGRLGTSEPASDTIDALKKSYPEAYKYFFEK